MDYRRYRVGAGSHVAKDHRVFHAHRYGCGFELGHVYHVTPIWQCDLLLVDAGPDLLKPEPNDLEICSVQTRGTCARESGEWKCRRIDQQACFTGSRYFGSYRGTLFWPGGFADGRNGQYVDGPYGQRTGFLGGILEECDLHVAQEQSGFVATVDSWWNCVRSRLWSLRFGVEAVHGRQECHEQDCVPGGPRQQNMCSSKMGVKTSATICWMTCPGRGRIYIICDGIHCFTHF